MTEANKADATAPPPKKRKKREKKLKERLEPIQVREGTKRRLENAKARLGFKGRADVVRLGIDKVCIKADDESAS